MSGGDFRCGFVAVVGRPNVGKSTLINAIVGRKVSIVTAKPQTTRHRIVGVRNLEDAQILFVDTPGIHRGGGKVMNRVLNRTAVQALADSDVVVFVSEAGRWTDADADVLQRIRAAGRPVIALLNKVDKVHPKERLLQALEAMSERHDFAELIPVSATRASNLDSLLAALRERLPVSPPLFPDEMHTDRGREFQAAEIIREKLTLMLHQELPYGLAVEIERWEDDADRSTIGAVIWVERDSQKGIVVGKGGSRLKQIGRAARLELREQFGRRVHLDLWVKVRENWADNEKDLRALGFDLPT